jgi:hypothetical protein
VALEDDGGAVMALEDGGGVAALRDGVRRWLKIAVAVLGGSSNRKTLFG